MAIQRETPDQPSAAPDTRREELHAQAPGKRPYESPRIITHSAQQLSENAPVINACGSYTEVEAL
jgi:hypothetical protein